MPVEVRVPTLGESVNEATIASWLKHEGDVVEAGEPLVELETDKVNVDVAAERSGVLTKIVRAAGETVQPGDVLAEVAEPGTASVASNGASAAAAPAATESAAVPVPAPAAAPEPPAQDRPHASPVARRMADEHQLDLGQITGSGTGGRVTREDVEQYLASRRQAAASAAPSTAAVAAVSAPAAPATVGARPADPRGEERTRMSRRRQTIAMRLLEAQRTAAMLTTFNEVDMSAVMALRSSRREAFQQRHGVGLGFMSFFTKATVAALKAFPNINAEIQGDEIVRKKYYDVGIAVAAAEGLVVPIIRDADRKGFAEIERTIVELAEKARNADAGRSARRHVHDHQRWRLRLAALHSDPQPAPGGHPRDA
jgi:2-oxoglutarate dehydrogenase E2 component (dihydrolipoamide succinyltransferase)